MPSRRATSATPADGRGMATADRRTSRLGAMGPAPPSPRRQEVCHLHFPPRWCWRCSPDGGYRRPPWWETIHLHARNTHVEGHRTTSSSVAPGNDYYRAVPRTVVANRAPLLVSVLARPPSKQHERPAGRLATKNDTNIGRYQLPVSVFAITTPQLYTIVLVALILSYMYSKYTQPKIAKWHPLCAERRSHRSVPCWPWDGR